MPLRPIDGVCELDRFWKECSARIERRSREGGFSMSHGKWSLSLALCLGMVVAAASSAMAQEKKAAEMPPDAKAAMEAMQKAATPGDAHKKLDAMIGTWDAKVSMWMDPSKTPEVSTGTSENK